MNTISARVRCASIGLVLTAALWCSAVQAQVLVHFDLPAQSLAKSLKAIGTATNTDVGFNAGQVAGFVAPSLNADLTVDGALMRVLVGTGLRSRYLDDHTIVIAAMKTTSDSAQETSLPTKLAARMGQRADALHTVKVADESSDLRLAQSDTALSDGASNSDTNADQSDRRQLKEVVVTGTHIRGVAPSSPVTTITREDIDRSGYTSIGDVIRSLPQNYNGGNSPQTMLGSAPGADNLSVSGGSSPNLRGLGSASTLTLVNGHRLAQDSPTGAVDISAIPLAAIDRVEVVLDGASAAYGSDAVAGVVNIILKKDYDGAQTTLQGGGTAHGGATEKQANQLLGTTWSTGGIIFDYEYDKLDAIYSTQRDYSLLAFTPTTLLPASERNSFFLSAHQDLSTNISGFVDALYTSRISRDAVTYSGPFETASEAGVHQYSVVPSLAIELPGGWRASPAANFTEQRTDLTISYSPPYLPSLLAYEGRTTAVDVNADGPLFSLPTGIVHAAIGSGYRRERFANEEQGSPSLVNAERSIEDAYAEIQFPLISPSDRPGLRRLDLNVSGRYEHYSDFGSQETPKLGLVYIPTTEIKARATWSRAFRAPTLSDMFNVQSVLLTTNTDPHSPTGTSNVLLPTGGNPGLRPETAKIWTMGFDYDPQWLKGLHTAATYYNIKYVNRISQIANSYTALTDPLNAPFVIRSPSVAYQQSLIDAAGPNFSNNTGEPYNPLDVAAVVNGKMINVARQNASGIDLSADYKQAIAAGTLDTFANATFLDLRQQIVPSAPDVEISGQAFQPSKFRARAGTSWGIGSWSTTAIINFVGGEVNTYQPDLPHVSSWTTVDVQLSYRFEGTGIMSGTKASLSVQNIFDRDPPYLLFDQYVPGLHYDPLNANVLGRFINLQLSKSFQ